MNPAAIDADQALDHPRPRSGSIIGRSLTKDAAVYGIGDIAGRALSFVSVPVYTHLFAPVQYSTLTFVTTASGLLATILIMGGDTAYVRFFFRLPDEQQRRDLTVTWIGFLATWSLGIALALLPLSRLTARWALDDRRLGILFVLMLIGLPVGQTSRMLAQVLRNQFRAAAYATTNFGSSLLGISLALYLVAGMHMGVEGVLIGYVVADGTMLLVRLALVRKMLRGRFDRSLLPQLIRFGAPLIAVSLCFWVFTMSDRIVLAKLSSLADLGRYSLAVAITSILTLVTGAAGQAWTPRSFEIYEQDKAQAAHVIGRLLTYFVMFMGILALLISTAAREIVSVVSPSAYSAAAGVIPLLSLGLVASGSALLTGTGISVSNRTSYAARYASYAAVANLGGAIALVPFLGMYGAAIASALGYTVLTTTYVWRSQRLWRINLEHRRLGVTAGALTAGILLTLSPSVQANPLKWLIPPLFIAAVVLVCPIPTAEIMGVGRSMLPMLRRRASTHADG